MNDAKRVTHQVAYLVVAGWPSGTKYIPTAAILLALLHGTAAILLALLHGTNAILLPYPPRIVQLYMDHQARWAGASRTQSLAPCGPPPTLPIASGGNTVPPGTARCAWLPASQDLLATPGFRSRSARKGNGPFSRWVSSICCSHAEGLPAVNRLEFLRCIVKRTISMCMN
jgi:hypothetical protein